MPHVELADQLVVVEFVGRAALEGDLAVHDHIAAVGDADRLREILLGHQHRQLVVLLELLDGVDGAARPAAARARPTARPPARCAVSSISARASASICCSPPLIEPASWLRRSARRGNASKQKSMLALDLRARLRAEGAEQQVFLHRQLGEQPAAFRHQRDAEIDDLLGGACRRGRASRRRSRRRCGPAIGRTMPITHFISVLLPLPLVPSSATVSPALTSIETSSITRTAP